jgi:membrane protease YdiL (CAAX protease family)
MLQSLAARLDSRHGTSPPEGWWKPGPSAKVAWRDVALYTFLTYAIAWTLFLPLIPNVFDLLSAERTPSDLEFSRIVVLGMWAPTIAAVLMRLFVSKEGLKGSLGPLRVPRFYALALLVPAVLVTLVIGIDVVTGWGEFAWDESVPLWLEYIVLAVMAVTFIGFLTFGEEYGWRGYLLPKLLPLGEVKAAIIVGLIWGPWHAPLLIAGLNYAGVNPFAAIGIFTLATVALSLLFTRLVVAAGGAVLVAAVVHGSFNSFSDTLTTTDHLTGDQLIVGGNERPSVTTGVP